MSELLKAFITYQLGTPLEIFAVWVVAFVITAALVHFIVPPHPGYTRWGHKSARWMFNVRAYAFIAAAAVSLWSAQLAVWAMG